LCYSIKFFPFFRLLCSVKSFLLRLLHHQYSTLTIFKMYSLLLALPLLTRAFPTSNPSFLPRQDKPYQIRGVQDPIYHFYLQALPSDPSVPVMGPEAAGEYFTISNTIQSTNTSMYLNIGASETSYLPLSFGEVATTTAWGLEGDTIMTLPGGEFGRRKFSPLL
jgi:hypothetical protein